MLAAEAEGHEIRTIEGMAQGDKLHPLQQKFLEMAALQCGICTSGMLVASDALLREESEAERGRGSLLARRQSLPLHRLRQDRPRGSGNRRRNAGGSTMNVVTDNKWIGQRTIRPDGADKVTGRAAFAADTTMPGMIWGKVLRSPHPHARIKSIDTSKAEALPGVKAVVTARDIVDFPIDKSVMLGIQDMRWMCRNVMAREKALFPGHPVAAVAATIEAIAAQACKLIEVDYEVLPWVDRDRRCAEARRADPARLHQVRGQAVQHRRQARGQDGRRRGRLRGGRRRRRAHLHDPPGASGLYRAARLPGQRRRRQQDHDLELEPGPVHGARHDARYLTGIPQSDIRAIPAEIGGGFGGKTIVYLEPLATLLAKKSGRPVKMVMTREEVMRATGPTSGSKSTVKIGAKKDGTIVAAQGTFYLQAGALPGLADPRRGGLRLRALRHPERALGRLRRASPTAPRSRPIARRARRSAPMRSSACSTSSPKR